MMKILKKKFGYQLAPRIKQRLIDHVLQLWSQTRSHNNNGGLETSPKLNNSGRVLAATPCLSNCGVRCAKSNSFINLVHNGGEFRSGRV
jgi:hypothetical protein